MFQIRANRGSNRPIMRAMQQRVMGSMQARRNPVLVTNQAKQRAGGCQSCKQRFYRTTAVR